MLSVYVQTAVSLCNVPTLGHQGITQCYDDQGSQLEIIAST
jgi:hypothetical protein